MHGKRDELLSDGREKSYSKARKQKGFEAREAPGRKQRHHKRCDRRENERLSLTPVTKGAMKRTPAAFPACVRTGTRAVLPPAFGKLADT